MSESPRLNLAIRNSGAVVDGAVEQFEIARRSVVIGRSPSADWTLPDSNSLVSSRHCEIAYSNGEYRLGDLSTNGTFLNGASERMPGPHVLRTGDHFQIGHYDIVATLAADANTQAPLSPPVPSPLARTELPPTAPAEQPRPVAPPPSAPGVRVPDTAAASNSAADDVWGKCSASYAVDWVRGGFEAPPPPSPAALARAITAAVGGPTDRAEPSRLASETMIAPFLVAAGLDPALFKNRDAEVLAAAGHLLRRLIGGLVVMLEARMRAKAQMGAQTTIFTREGNNPIKFARSPESALGQLLNPPISGYMGADRAVEDSFRDLQLHQMAMLKGMQGALRETLRRFSPDAIGKRAESRGILKRIMPGSRESALWKAYEREFSGVAEGSDEAFMDIFAKEFRRAYDEQAAALNAETAARP